MGSRKCGPDRVGGGRGRRELTRAVHREDADHARSVGGEQTVTAPSERMTWAAEVVAAEPGERVLEVGCGPGALVALLADRGAEVVGIDRSAAVVASAVRRNRVAVEAGRVQLLTAPLVDADLGRRGSFDVVVAFDVRAFWDSGAAATWAVVDRALATPGRVVVAFSVMRPGAEVAVVDAVAEHAARRGLVVDGVSRRPATPIGSVAVRLLRRVSAG
ncbi:SAM-dependent methyltransferase [Geodermatophilus sp. SYSU D00965]